LQREPDSGTQLLLLVKASVTFLEDISNQHVILGLLQPQV
jgi:hypothetical protein